MDCGKFRRDNASCRSEDLDGIGEGDVPKTGGWYFWDEKLEMYLLDRRFRRGMVFKGAFEGNAFRLTHYRCIMVCRLGKRFQNGQPGKPSFRFPETIILRDRPNFSSSVLISRDPWNGLQMVTHTLLNARPPVRAGSGSSELRNHGLRD